MAANKYRPGSLSHRVYLLKIAQFWKDAAKAARKRKIALVARIRPLPTILSVYILSSHAISEPHPSTPGGCTDCM